MNMKTENKILVVDDDFAHRTMLKTLVGGWGYEVREADDGATAVEAATVGNCAAWVTVQKLGMTGTATPAEVRRAWAERERQGLR